MALLSSSLHSARAHARDWIECALNLAFPEPISSEAEPVPIEAPFCRQCGDAFRSMGEYDAEFVCQPCTQHKWYFKWARAAYRTEGQVREAVTGFKYRDHYYRRALLVDWLSDVYERYASEGKWDGLVPVPLYHRRYRERGFNQARELADGLGTKTGVGVLDCLYRYRETETQARLTRIARWQNMVGAFKLKRRFDVKGKNLLIIDDVFTTGATVNACAQVLAKAGAAQLAVLTVARS